MLNYNFFNMKPIITFFMSFILSYIVTGQQFQDEKEYQADNNTYKCRYRVSQSLGIHFFTFTNTQNVLQNMNTGIRGTPSKMPGIESNRKLLELLYEVYGGKEKMQAMGSETIDLYCYIGMDFSVKELRITLSSETENIKTTILQVEAIENLVKERIRFIFDRESPYYTNALYDTSSSHSYIISEIPAARPASAAAR